MKRQDIGRLVQNSKFSRDSYGNIIIESGVIPYKNFAGDPAKDINGSSIPQFTLAMPVEIGQQLLEEGWNIKFREPVDELDIPYATTNVNAPFNTNGWRQMTVEIIDYVHRNRTQLNADSMGDLDKIELKEVDLVIHPSDNYRKNPRAQYHYKGYLNELHAHVREDTSYFGGKYDQLAEEWGNEEAPF